MIEVRTATTSDARAILDIYAQHVLKSFCTFESEVPAINEVKERIKKCIELRPWLVCVIDGLLVGYVYASSHRERVAYQWSCESSVYTHSDFSGAGIGQQLYKTLFDILKMQGYRNVYAGITLPNEASIKLHEKIGFTHLATYENVGYKLGEWKNVGWWKLRLNDYDPNPSPPLKFSEMVPSHFQTLFSMAARNISESLTY